MYAYTKHDLEDFRWLVVVVVITIGQREAHIPKAHE